jgi:hypothetical protein
LDHSIYLLQGHIPTEIDDKCGEHEKEELEGG